MPCGADPVAADPGDTVALRWRAMSTGDVASAPFTWVAVLSDDPDIDPATDTVLAQVTGSSGWPAGFDTGDRSTTATLPADASPGVWYLAILLDRDGVVAESDETDNLCVAGVVVVGDDGPPPPTTRWLVPAGASAPGVGTSNWLTQIAIANPTDAPRVANLYYVASGSPWPGVLLSGPITVGPRGTAYLDDVLRTLRPTTGLLYVVLDAPGPVVTSRTYNLAAGGATFGQGIPGVPLDGVEAPTELVLPMFHSMPDRFRTNLGLVQTSGGTFQVEVTVFNASGTQLGSKVYSRGTAWFQVNNLLGDMGLGGMSVEGGWIRVRLVGGSPAYWTCYASVVDADTDDPTYVVPVAVVPLR